MPRDIAKSVPDQSFVITMNNTCMLNGIIFEIQSCADSTDPWNLAVPYHLT